MTYDEIDKKTENVGMLLAEDDKKLIYKYAQQVPENGIIVDIGTAGGGSAVIESLGNKGDVKVYTIDVTANIHFLENKKRFGLEEKLTQILKPSEEVAKEWTQPIDMLFIDGIHSYWGVKTDLEGLGKFVKKGGFILCHDYFLYGEEQIMKAVQEAVEAGFIETLEIIKSYYRDDPRAIGVFAGRKL